ncbi:hypothetical protein M427DRAFT_37603 [Gonapodya prolifera JEL478]|uniref:Uncharacterized protein n=1 Tax=Gonapodya prolifera (strain JEL478) TaxID=1344416 RepID=A0A139A0H1_GONPJ|nr:hypothetical protein M427DRAFT_37603 [Gonapodya prolifera JEL478]|eukprot:KXS10232.1 hypothetical protein M427DRAFT_37603 [Gonapodya prolifera JEL478]
MNSFRLNDLPRELIREIDIRLPNRLGLGVLNRKYRSNACASACAIRAIAHYSSVGAALQAESQRGARNVVLKLLARTPRGDVAACKALMLATFAGHAHVLETLLDCHTPDNCFKYALRWAAMKGHLHVVKTLIDHCNGELPPDDEPLRWACLHGHADVARTLLEQRPSARVTIVVQIH